MFFSACESLQRNIGVHTLCEFHIFLLTMLAAYMFVVLGSFTKATKIVGEKREKIIFFRGSDHCIIEIAVAHSFAIIIFQCIVTILRRAIQ